MIHIKSGDADIAYQIVGSGPPIVLLHPFPVHHEFWLPAAQALASRYQLVLPDLRGHGDSTAGEGPATMEKHAGDMACVLDHAEIGRASFAGVSIGGYALFEFWRRYRGRVAALALCNTKAQADSPEAKAGRLQAAADVLERGTETFFEGIAIELWNEAVKNVPSAAEVDYLERQLGKKPLSTVKSCHHAAKTHSASVSRFVRRATRSRFGIFEPWPLSRTIFLNP